MFVTSYIGDVMKIFSLLCLWYMQVSPGSDCLCDEDVAVINTEEKSCCVLGGISHRAVVTPNVDSLLNVISLD